MKILIELQNPSFEGVVMHDEATLKSLNNDRKDKLHLNIIQKRILGYNLGYCLSNDNFFTQIYLKKTAQLIDGGFFQRNNPPVKEEEPDNRVVLTLDHLAVGFSIWCLMLLIALLVFLAEQFLSKAQNLLRMN